MSLTCIGLSPALDDKFSISLRLNTSFYMFFTFEWKISKVFCLLSSNESPFLPIYNPAYLLCVDTVFKSSIVMDLI